MDNLKQIDFSEEYLKEVEDTFMIRHEFGAMWYKFGDQNDCWIVGTWVVPSRRRSRIAFDLADKVMMIAKEKGCRLLMAKLRPGQGGATVSLKTQLAYGFQLSPEIIDGYLILFKEIS